MGFGNFGGSTSGKLSDRVRAGASQGEEAVEAQAVVVDRIGKSIGQKGETLDAVDKAAKSLGALAALLETAGSAQLEAFKYGDKAGDTVQGATSDSPSKAAAQLGAKLLGVVEDQDDRGSQLLAFSGKAKEWQEMVDGVRKQIETQMGPFLDEALTESKKEFGALQNATAGVGDYAEPI